MANQSNRSFRAKILTQGAINFNGINYPVVIKNISTTGVLAQFLDNISKENNVDAQLASAERVQLNLPEINLDSSVEVVRVYREGDTTFFAVKFVEIAADHLPAMELRKVSRTKADGAGFILLNGEYLEFNALNMSDTGLMVVVHKKIIVAPGTVTVLEFKTMELSAKVKIVWLEHLAGNQTSMGLEFIVKY